LLLRLPKRLIVAPRGPSLVLDRHGVIPVDLDEIDPRRDPDAVIAQGERADGARTIVGAARVRPIHVTVDVRAVDGRGVVSVGAVDPHEVRQAWAVRVLVDDPRRYDSCGIFVGHTTRLPGPSRRSSRKTVDA